MGNCGSNDLKSTKRSSSRSFTSRDASPEHFCKTNSFRRTVSTKTDKQLVVELFQQFDLDKDDFLNEAEIQAFLLYLCNKRGKSLKKVDENVIGHFLTQAGIIDEVRISKQDFVNHFKDL